MADLPKVNWVDDFVVAIWFVAIQILGLTSVTLPMLALFQSTKQESVTRVVEKQGVVRAGIFYQPMHCPEDILFCRLAHGVLLIVGEENHVLPLVAEILV
jgi:hypothetical protein